LLNSNVHSAHGAHSAHGNASCVTLPLCQVSAKSAAKCRDTASCNCTRAQARSRTRARTRVGTWLQVLVSRHLAALRGTFGTLTERGIGKMNATRSLREFFVNLARQSGMPLHAWFTKHGHAWPAMWGPAMCVYHHVLVLPYVGDFNGPTNYRRVVPRIHLNHHDSSGHAPATKLEHQARAQFPVARVSRYGSKLELTATIEELPQLAAWVVAWAHARVAMDQGLSSALPEVPFALEHSRSPEELLRCDYVWTKAASEEYESAPATIFARKRDAERRQLASS